jgi:hypothetical protein
VIWGYRLVAAGRDFEHGLADELRAVSRGVRGQDLAVGKLVALEFAPERKQVPEAPVHCMMSNPVDCERSMIGANIVQQSPFEELHLEWGGSQNSLPQICVCGLVDFEAVLGG